ncbi:MAG: MFS transporter [Paludisphaera borealis]|uniref:MFS transporter n=1 Tax=Paludisphaera borealis TaxID=1387353 RepID=UPI0028482256|nr:MFS transporter [Paludisphaera borealis]MDR3621782.1 MFS transporter [Paludisphaera borealis]
MSPLAIVILIVLIDLLGFALVMPLLGPFAKQYLFEGWQLGLLFAAFPICQLIAGPILGRLSDRYGRRPLLVFSQAGTALSFLILGLSRNFRVMLLGRMLDGASGGNIVVAQAYVADVTPPEHRTRNMGLIGMAFGVGFVLGPLLGALLSDLPIAADWRLRLPFLVAAAFSTLAWIVVVWKLPESIPVGSAPRQAARVLSRRGIIDTIQLPGVAQLVAVAFLSVLAWATMEGTFAVFLQDRMSWSPSAIGFAFAGSGLVSALVQGGLIRPLVPRYGEIRLILVGVVLAGLGFVGVAAMSGASAWPLVGAVVLFSVGSGLVSPSISGLLSRITPMSEQGAVFGALTSTQTLARIISYMTGNILLARVSPSAPYWFGAAIYLVALLAAARFAPVITAVLARSQEIPAAELAVGEGA